LSGSTSTGFAYIDYKDTVQLRTFISDRGATTRSERVNEIRSGW
jgi:ribosomal protein S18